MNYILYNPISGHGNCKVLAEKLADTKEACQLLDMTALSYSEFLSGLTADDTVTVCGGDGTLNRFVNAIPENEFKNRVFY